MTFQKKLIAKDKPVFKVFLKKTSLSVQGFFKQKVFFLVNKSRQLQMPMKALVAKKYP